MTRDGKLGRNPFEKKTPPLPAPAPEPIEARDQSLLEWAAVDLPVQIVIGGLRAGLLAHSVWTGWQSRKSKSSKH